jgi:hypothetical protein
MKKAPHEESTARCEAQTIQAIKPFPQSFYSTEIQNDRKHCCRWAHVAIVARHRIAFGE